MKRLLALAAALSPWTGFAGDGPEHVILLHGLCRTSRSMIPMERSLSKAGYQVFNVDYPSRSGAVVTLAEDALGKAVVECQRRGAVRIHFVTHSLGGILVRSYLTQHSVTNLGRIVMIGPPNQGSEVVDRLGSLWLFKKINGPAGNELGTGANSTPNTLGAPDYCVGVIAGNRSVNWINSLLIPGADDGKVSVERSKLKGMADHVVIPASHPFIMGNKDALQQTIHFLRTGRFSHPCGHDAR